MAKPSAPEATEFCSPQAWLEDTGHYDLVLEEDRPEDTWFDVPVDRLPCPDGWRDLEEMHPEYVFVYEDLLGKATVRRRTDREAADMLDSLNRELDKFRLLRLRMCRKATSRKFTESLSEVQQAIFNAEDDLLRRSFQAKKGGA